MAYQGLVAVITGGASGIGFALATGLVKEGAKVVLGDLQESLGQESAGKLNKISANSAIFHKTDVTDWESTRGLFKAAVDAFGTVDLAFPNAGISGPGFPGAIDRDVTEAPNVSAINVDLTAVIYTIQAALDIIRRKPDPSSLPASEHPFRRQWRGKIISTSSQSAIYPLPFSSVYGAAKVGVWNLAQTLGLLLLPEKITVNCVAPGMVPTPIYSVAPDLIKSAQEKNQHTPLETITKAFFTFLPTEVDATGQLAEATQNHVVFREWVPYLNEETKEIWESHWFTPETRNYKYGAKVLPSFTEA